MPDFHKSLDEAIERLEGRLDKLPKGYEDAGYLLEDSEGPQTIQGQSATLYVLDEAQEWRDANAAFRIRYALGLGQDPDNEPDWNITLCEREIPERGTE